MTWAQWTKPAAPAMQPLAVDEPAYLYNADAGAFWLGANDWGTRASISSEHGWKVSLAQYTLDESKAWDGKSYMIMSLVEKPGGWQDGQTMAAKIADWNSIWVDAEDGNQDDKGWVFTQLEDGTYEIGLSPLDIKMYDVYMDAVLCALPGSDTRLSLYSHTNIDENPEAYCNRWYFVSEANYTAYITALKQYNAAAPLGEEIAVAKEKFPTIDISEIEAVYNNTSSTPEQLTAARHSLTLLLMSAASPETPVDVTWKYVTNATYDNNDNAGWKGTEPGLDKYGNAEFYNRTYNYSQALTITEGVYRVGVTGFYRAGGAANDAAALAALENGEAAPQNALLYVTSTALDARTAALPFASTGATADALGDNTLNNDYGYIPNTMATAATYMAQGKYPATTVLGMAGNDGTLTIGLKKDATIADDWTLFDNWKVEFLGNNAEAFAYLRNDYVAQVTDYPQLINDGELEYYGREAYSAYTAARQALDAATTSQDIAKAMATFAQAEKVLAENIAAYQAFATKFEEINDYLGDNGDKLMGEKIDFVFEYLEGDEGPGIDNPAFPNGGALYILENGTLSTDAIIAEIAFMQKLFDDALASSMQDGQDCTELIKNSHFNEEGVWTKDGLASWPLGSDTYKLAEAYSIKFDVFQTLTGLQNGLYELQLNDLYRPASYDSEGYYPNFRAYVYYE